MVFRAKRQTEVCTKMNFLIYKIHVGCYWDLGFKLQLKKHG